MRVECSSKLDNLGGQIASLEREQPVLSAEIEQIHRQLHDAQQKKTVHQTEAANSSRIPPLGRPRLICCKAKLRRSTPSRDGS